MVLSFMWLMLTKVKIICSFKYLNVADVFSLSWKDLQWIVVQIFVFPLFSHFIQDWLRIKLNMCRGLLKYVSQCTKCQHFIINCFFIIFLFLWKSSQKKPEHFIDMNIKCKFRSSTIKFTGSCVVKKKKRNKLQCKETKRKN